MNKIAFLFIFALLIGGCNTGPDAYVDWYNNLKPYTQKVANGTVIFKEVTTDLIFIQTHIDDKSNSDLQEFRKNINVRHLSFEYKKQENGIANNQLFGKDLECAIDGIPPLDVIHEVSNKGIPLKVTFIFDKVTYDKGNQIQVAHPEIKDIISLKLSDIRIKNNKELNL